MNTIIQYLWAGTGWLLNSLNKLRVKLFLPFLKKWIISYEEVRETNEQPEFPGNSQQRRKQRRAWIRKQQELKKERAIMKNYIKGEL